MTYGPNGRVRIRRLGFRRNGPRNIYDPLATFQTPPTWHYGFLGTAPAAERWQVQPNYNYTWHRR